MSPHDEQLATEQEARDVAESARESEWHSPSFLKELFLGKLRMDLIDPFPQQTPEEEARAKPFMDKLRALMDRVDSDKIDREGIIPESVVQELRDIGAFGIKIDPKYGGLGLSQTSYIRAIGMVTSKDGSITALLSAHQSIGLSGPLKLFGTEEQKKKYLPRLAKGSISAFALTEVDAGSDPANMRTTATPTEDGKHFILNGTKLWCTNGTRCELLVVMARTPDAIVNGKPKKQITAFIVETSMPGVKVTHRNHFMGLKAIENAVLEFTNVKVPRENIIWEEGRGLKLALVTLNTGRLTLPASCAYGAKQMLRVAREWSNKRVQWGQPIGKHEAVAQKVAHLAGNVFAMESVAELASGLADRGNYDIRLEAASGKLWNTEAGWRAVDDTLQIRGGRGYETADSLRARGEEPIPVERAMRDFRINLIFEGSSEIMRLFIAREAVDHHFKTAFDLVNPKATGAERWAAFVRSLKFYPLWYPSMWIGGARSYREFGALSDHMRYIERTTRKLGRSIFHAMVRLGPKLEKRQMVLFRLVDVGAELFAMAASCSRAKMLAAKGEPSAIEIADLFCREARLRIAAHFRDLFGPNDKALHRVSQKTLEGTFSWLEEGIVRAESGESGTAPVVETARRREPVGV
ncbi:MAG TPA: acyl-CoA dehydrogenase family protein [Gemmatimonadaceae bacterium]|nr:acyl-CoA dehydrogenase family protein [Gemmatimonadaceae bacterium]